MEMEYKDVLNENIKLKSEITCIVCRDKTRNVLYLPCNHLLTCNYCGPCLINCPVCRKQVKHRIRVYPAWDLDVITYKK